MSNDDENHNPSHERGLPTDPIYGRPPSDSSTSKPDKTMPSDEPGRLASSESAQIVQICKSCMISQNDGGSFCVKCGDELVPIRSVEDSCIGDVVGGKYTIVDKIGAGGMGDVYRGLNEPLGQQVAIKFLNEKFTSDERIVLRFLNEARSYCKVNHPNAVTLLEYGQHDDGSLYLITEYIEGEGLTQLVRRESTLATETIVSVGVQVCEVLSAAHAQGIIHRDLKPDNLMMISGSRGRYAVKVLDFGIAKIADEDMNGPKTETGSVFGTPEFMSPEQARGDSVGPRSDIYALGVLFYYMATGTLPFQGSNKLAILNKQIHDEPRPPSEVAPGRVHPGLEEIILQCLSKKQDQRPASADEVAEALEALEWEEEGSDSASSTAAVASKNQQEDSPIGSDDEPAEIKGKEEDKPVDDGPVKEFEAVEPIGMSTFDEKSEELIDDAFDEDVDPMAATVGEELGDTDGELLRSRFDTDEPGSQRSYRVDSRLGKPAKLRRAAIGFVATLAVIGGVIMWTTQEGAEQETSQVSAGDAPTAVWDGRTAAALAVVAAYVDAGDFKSADATLAGLNSEAMSDPYRNEYEEIISQASRARNTEMQLRSSVESRECSRAADLLERLAQASTGAADEHRELVERCERGDDVEVAADLPSDRGGRAGDADHQGATGAARGPTPPPPPEDDPEPAPEAESSGSSSSEEAGDEIDDQAPEEEIAAIDESHESQGSEEPGETEPDVPSGDEAVDEDRDESEDIEAPDEEPDIADGSSQSAESPEDSAMERPAVDSEAAQEVDDQGEQSLEESEQQAGEELDEEADEDQDDEEQEDPEDDVVLPPSEI